MSNMSKLRCVILYPVFPKVVYLSWTFWTFENIAKTSEKNSIFGNARYDLIKTILKGGSKKNFRTL